MLRTKTSAIFILAGLFWLVTAALAAQPADGGVVIFPVVLTADANGSGFFGTTLHLMNLSNTTTTVEVAAFSNRKAVPP